jgi:hypothetical protein
MIMAGPGNQADLTGTLPQPVRRDFSDFGAGEAEDARMLIRHLQAVAERKRSPRCEA